MVSTLKRPSSETEALWLKTYKRVRKYIYFSAKCNVAYPTTEDMKLVKTDGQWKIAEDKITSKFQ